MPINTTVYAMVWYRIVLLLLTLVRTTIVVVVVEKEGEREQKREFDCTFNRLY